VAQCCGYCCVCVCVCEVQFISALILYKMDCKHCFVVLSYVNVLLYTGGGGRLLQCTSLCVGHRDGNKCKWTERNDVK
jgi:hypothetical protein